MKPSDRWKWMSETEKKIQYYNMGLFDGNMVAFYSEEQVLKTLSAVPSFRETVKTESFFDPRRLPEPAGAVFKEMVIRRCLAFSVTGCGQLTPTELMLCYFDGFQSAVTDFYSRFKEHQRKAITDIEKKKRKR